MHNSTVIVSCVLVVQLRLSIGRRQRLHDAHAAHERMQRKHARGDSRLGKSVVWSVPPLKLGMQDASCANDVMNYHKN